MENQQDLEVMAILVLEVIQDRLNMTELTPFQKIMVIRDAVNEWGCTVKQAANYNRFAKYDDGSCIYTAPPAGGS